jgi:thioredoxin 1
VAGTFDGYAGSMQNLPQVTDGSFRAEILQASVPVLVDFWAPWCAYCRAMAPIVEQVATEYGARLKVVGVNADAEGTTVQHFVVRSLPTFLLVRDGQVRDQIVGAVTKTRLQQAIDRVVSGA